MTSGTAPKETNYESWSPTQLVERIKQLESQLPPPPKPQLSLPESTMYPYLFLQTNNSPTKPSRSFEFDKYPTRYIAIKYAYLGWDYSGVAYCSPDVHTVETELFKALKKVKLVQDIETCKYSRCGRTDKGVSAMGQVSALMVRSNINPEDRLENGGRGYSLDERGQSKGEELDYVQRLNWVLPSTIRVIAWTPVPDDFDARFSCRGRQYRYFFTNLYDELDISAMRTAAEYFIGEHDFRNFCKLDVKKQITNFHRRIHKADIVPYNGLPENPNSKMWMLELHGSAFLWHQVRCMMAILFLVGQKLEEPEIVKELLDMEKNPKKPDYEMAYDIPLVLYDCLYDGLEWRYPEESSRSRDKMLQNLFSTWHEQKLRETMAGLFCTSFARSREILMGKNTDNKIGIWNGSGFPKPIGKYRKVEKRPRQEAFEVANERFRKTPKYERQQKRIEAKAKLHEDTRDTDNGDTMEGCGS
jgi:tRNA pseudouridine38/39 synthase